jgi:hypothetical protein
MNDTRRVKRSASSMSRAKSSRVAKETSIDWPPKYFSADTSMPSTPHLELIWMSKGRSVPIREMIGDTLRFLAGWLLALLMLLPALVITLADKITMWRIRNRMQRDRQS